MLGRRELCPLKQEGIYVIFQNYEGIKFARVIIHTIKIKSSGGYLVSDFCKVLYKRVKTVGAFMCSQWFGITVSVHDRHLESNVS